MYDRFWNTALFCGICIPLATLGKLKWSSGNFLALLVLYFIFNIYLITIAPILTHLAMKHFQNGDTLIDLNPSTGYYLGKLMNFKVLQRTSRHFIPFYVLPYTSNYLANETITRLLSHANVDASQHLP